MTHHDLLDAAVGTAPPTTINLDAIIAKQRRQRIERRLLGAVALTVATTGLVVAAALGSHR
jgi:hypothetical protein